MHLYVYNHSVCEEYANEQNMIIVNPNETVKLRKHKMPKFYFTTGHI